MSVYLFRISSFFLTLTLAASWCFAQNAATNAPVSAPEAHSLQPWVPTPAVEAVIPEPLPPNEQLPLGSVTAPQPTTAQLSATGSNSWFVQTALALGLVIGLILLLRLGLKRLGAQSGFGSARGLVEVLARSTIGPKTQVVFLKVNQRVIVAGQTPAGINTLATLDDPDEVASILARIQAARPASITRSFARLVGQLDQSYEPSESQSGADSDEHAVDRARDQVSGLLGRIRNQHRSDE